MKDDAEFEAWRQERDAVLESIRKTARKLWPRGAARRLVKIGRANAKRLSVLAAMTEGKPSIDRYVNMLIESDWDLWINDGQGPNLTKVHGE